MTAHAAPTAIDPRELRTAMSRFATGVAVVTTFDGEKREGLTVNSFLSLSLDPPLVVWSLRKNSPSSATFQVVLQLDQLRGRDQRGQLLPRVEYARLYRGLGDADYLGNLLDGFRSA